MSDEDAAARIAISMRDKPGETRTWYEVRTLLHDFELPRFTRDTQDRITSALAEAGVAIEPDLHTRERRDTVFLSLTGNGRPRAAPVPIAEAMTVRIAYPDGRMTAIPFDEAANQTDAVLWFDVTQPQAVDAEAATASLARFCPGVTVEMVDDLISPDPRPKAVRYADGTIRSLSTFSARSLESDDGVADDSASMAGVLVFDPVEILAGPGWLVTCWHKSQKFRGAVRIEQLTQTSNADIYKEIERCWRDGYSTSGDLAVLLMYELAATYKPTCRHLRVWEEEWELDYFRTDHADDATLIETQGSVALLRDWLSPMNIAGIRDDINRAWFADLSGDAARGGHERALRVDNRVDQSLAELAEISKLIRDAYQLLEVRRVSMAQDRDARFQRTIAIGGSAILIPTLVAGVMGMNVWVPGEYGPESAKWAFAVLLVVMLITAGLAWYALKRMHQD